MAFFNAPDAQGDAGISLDDVSSRAPPAWAAAWAGVVGGCAA